jgi:hypothetical protein
MVGGIDIADEDDEDAGLSGGGEQRGQAQSEFLGFGGVPAVFRDQAAIGDKIVLHVDDKQCTMRRVDLFPHAFEQIDMRQSARDLEIFRRVVPCRVVHGVLPGPSSLCEDIRAPSKHPATRKFKLVIQSILGLSAAIKASKNSH